MSASKSASVLVVLCCLVALGAFAGCGGEDEEPLSKKEFVAEANSICKGSDREVLKQLSSFVKEQPNEGKGMTQNQLFAKAVDEVLLPAAQEKVTDIGSLEPPPADEKRVDAYLAAMEQGVDAVEAKGPSYAALKASLYEFEKRFTPAAKIAGQYGIDSCQ